MLIYVLDLCIWGNSRAAGGDTVTDIGDTVVTTGVKAAFFRQEVVVEDFLTTGDTWVSSGIWPPHGNVGLTPFIRSSTVATAAGILSVVTVPWETVGHPVEGSPSGVEVDVPPPVI